MSHDQFHLTDIPTDHIRNAWQPDTDELHMNVLVLRTGERIEKHVNQVLDVIVTCLKGSGTITIDEEDFEVVAGSIVLIRRGMERIIAAGPDGITYTTVHRKRGGIMPTVSKRNTNAAGAE